MADEKEKLLQIARLLKDNKYVSDGVNKGSISLKGKNGNIIVSPSKVSYDELSSDRLNVVDINGAPIEENAPFSRDMYFHLKIYKERPDVNAIIHTHSKYATALALANKGIPFILYGMKFHTKGEVKVAPFSFPNTKECNDSIIQYLGDRNAVLLGNHGLVCVGENIDECYQTVEFVESLSESYIHALSIGKVEEIRNWREVNYG